MKDTIAKKKAAFTEKCWFLFENDKSQYKRLKNSTRKVVARAVRKKAKQELIYVKILTLLSAFLWNNKERKRF